MEYTKKTQDLLDRMNAVASRKEYVFDKEKITELVEKSYKLFDLKVPDIEWCVDITDPRFEEAARAAWAAGAAGAARAARAAGAAGAAWAAWAAGAARAARAAGAAGAAWAAWAARAAGAAGAAWAAWAAGAARAVATDYDGQEYIYSYEFCQTNEHNEEDRKFNQAGELFLQLKEAGAGYWAEQDGTVYICPNPIILLENNVYHSDQKPAISWKNGIELFYLDGVHFEKPVWEKILSQTMSFKDIMAIEISDQRTVALKYNPGAIIRENAKLVHADDRSNELYLIENQQLNKDLNFPKIWFLKMTCPTGRIFIEGVPPDEAEKNPNATDMQALLCGLTPSEYQSMVMES